MNRKVLFLTVLLAVPVGFVYAQSFGNVDYDKADAIFEVDTERGFTAQVEINTNLLQMTSVNFSDEKERILRSGYSLTNNYPFGGINILDGTNVGFAYNSDWYGGNLSLNSGGLGGIKAWIGFWDNKLKISAGNDIGYGYADSQGADAGLRVYDDSVRNTGEGEKENESIDISKNPDNITRDQGVLLEISLDPIKIALAGGGNFVDMAKNMGNVQMIRTATYEQEPVYGYRLQYGVNIGGKIGDFAKINGAYILQSEKNETLYEYIQAAKEIKPKQADTEITTHLFGAYGSVYPLGNDSLGITVGYAGVFVQYLKEFSADSTTVRPQIMKNGINLTARYKLDKLTIKTDHNYSFWADKNYRIFNLHKPYVDLKDYGLRSADTNAADFADVNHSFIWNGIGASYNFTPVIEGSIYARNLVRIDETPKYRMLNDYFSVELRSNFRFSPMVEAYMGIVYQYTGRVTSKELSEDVAEFSPGNTAKETNDSRSMIQIPLGFKVKLQR
ncbi:MAG: hypothetical protein LBG91_00905 [Treponema sp.]|jgi:hypothetical protein|nr:hypothetical protein [Treponema sp.]